MRVVCVHKGIQIVFISKLLNLVNQSGGNLAAGDTDRLKPKKIIDLGCGTGSNTIKLKQIFPEALVTGLDLSPYMLIMAQKKAEDKNLQIQWKHGLAEATEMLTNSYDLINLSLLLHENPNFISQLIMTESFRLLKSQGQLIILNANQNRLKHL